eukprot:4462306-Prymnesium_polylepis.1
MSLGQSSSIQSTRARAESVTPRRAAAARAPRCRGTPAWRARRRAASASRSCAIRRRPPCAACAAAPSLRASGASSAGGCRS